MVVCLCVVCLFVVCCSLFVLPGCLPVCGIGVYVFSCLHGCVWLCLCVLVCLCVCVCSDVCLSVSVFALLRLIG